MSTDDTRPTMTKTEAAGLLGVDVRTLGAAIEDGTIPAIKIGKRVLILRGPFMRMLAGEDTRTVTGGAA